MNNYMFEKLPEILKSIEDRLEKIEATLKNTVNEECDQDDFMGTKRASELLKFSITTLYTKVCKREVPFYKRGNRLYFSKAELLTWIQEGKKKSVEDIKSKALKIADQMNKRGALRK